MPARYLNTAIGKATSMPAQGVGCMRLCGEGREYLVCMITPAPPALFNCGLEAALKLTSTGYVVCIKDQEHSLGRPLQL